MWDNLTCWQASKVGDVVSVKCPELFVVIAQDNGESLCTPALCLEQQKLGVFCQKLAN